MDDLTPLAYDILMSPGTAAEVDGLQRIAKRWLPARTGRPAWLEPACGSGRYLRVAARRGVRCFGFDRDPAMVAFARRTAVGGTRVFQADMARFARQLGARRIDFAFNLHNTIRLLESDAAVLAHLRQMGRVLRPDGAYAVGLSRTRYGAEAIEEDVWEGRRGTCRVVQLVQYLPPRGRGRFEQVVSCVRVERPGGASQHDSTYRLRCFNRVQWQRLVARSPFRIAASVNGRGTKVQRDAQPYAIDILVPSRTGPS